MTDKIAAVQVDSIFDSNIPGAFAWAEIDGDTRQILYVCPCRCGQLRSLAVKKGPNERGKYWGWDGDDKAPTLQPSIQHVPDRNPKSCDWHGFLRAGYWVTA